MTTQFTIAHSSLFMKGYQVAFRILLGETTWLDNLTAKQAADHCNFLNNSLYTEAN